MNESFSAINKLLAHLDTKVNTELADFLIIGLDWLNRFRQELWNVSLAEVDGSHESIVPENWHDSWDKWLGNASCFAIFDPLEVDLAVIEQLRNNDVGTGITFFLQILDVEFSIGLSHMHLWISRNNNAEVVSVSLSDKLNKLRGIGETIFDCNPVVNSCWWITTKGQNVSDSIFFRFVQRFDNTISR